MSDGQPTQFLSDRGIPLIWCHRRGADCLPPARPTITVEQWCKWYCLFVVMPDGTVQRLGYDELPVTLGSYSYVDHVPAPDAVSAAAWHRDWGIDEVALEVIVGRWQMEVVDD